MIAHTVLRHSTAVLGALVQSRGRIEATWATQEEEWERVKTEADMSPEEPYQKINGSICKELFPWELRTTA